MYYRKVLGAVLVIGLVGGLGAGAWGERTPGSGSAFVPEAERTVTLITGDRVTLDRDGRSVRVWPGPGRDAVKFSTHRRDGQTHIIPGDAIDLLASGVLDRRLFNVDALLEFGYGDSRRADLPLIVQYGQAVARSAARSGIADAGVRITRELSSVDSSAATVGKADAGTFWAALSGAGRAKLNTQGGIGKVWLDGMRLPLLDRSAVQIGAPAAWRAGYTGAGVTVAVLDSGVDATHPDLAGKVVEAKNFTDDPNPADTIGHGTHVASILAGTGAASHGRYRGIAPDATLLSGKVCGEFFCPESAILAAMQWAAVDRRAKVVNLSLGGPDTPELDPLEQAVNRLTAEQGTLFVIAAGNADSCGDEGRVGSPGSADAALTVGAVDADDALADFSCTGPRLADGAIKPDLTAPGVGIVAARVAGTPAGDSDPVDDHYARQSGTSMATPHVAGAAAVLAQQHPDWRAGQLKAALMGSAQPDPASTPFMQGAGRLDLARAISQTLTAAPPSLSLGLQRWPHKDDQPITRTVTLRNPATDPVTLTLRVQASGPDGRPAPASMFALSATTLTVAAGGQASVSFTADTRIKGPDGRYSGRIVATGDATITVPFAIDREIESYDLTIRHLGRSGVPASAFFGLVFAPRVRDYFGGSGGTVIMRLPRGSYPVAVLVDESAGLPEPVSTMLGAPKVALVRDTVLTFDARAARPVDVTPPRSSVSLAAGAVGLNVVTDTGMNIVGILARSDYKNIFVGNVGPTGDRHRFVSYVWGDWLEPGADGSFVDSRYAYHLTWFEPGRVFDGLTRHPRDRDLATVVARHPAPPGRVALKFSHAAPDGNPLAISGLHAPALLQQFRLPATRIEFYTTEGVQWRTEIIRFRDAGDGLLAFEAQHGSAWGTLRRGLQAERWGVGVFGPSLPAPHLPVVWVRQFPDRLIFRVPMFGGGTPGRFGELSTDSAHTTLYQDGRKVAESGGAAAVVYQAPSESARYRVDAEATQSVYDTSTRITASWGFRSPPVQDITGALLPVMVVRFSPQLDSTSRALAGVPFLIPVSVEHQPGAPGPRIKSLTVDVSYDDGQTWRRADLIRRPHGWAAMAHHPSSGFVSLRAEAVDTDGNTVEQTIIRAYGLRTR